ncbi:hypothetical protein DCCM_4745 [Desulfocucumis palustris]|uniref:Outer membrane efflux protein n=1 Tax=Desulfocucumis palustris TaxID=1898651 RepID=A0A2L2XMQ0_9FIRM|nr:TolC family protein [Desulfocucumis palustris]GBF35616.1 hypothetical protein DCCM_4745 [Desulfocucumis palustris]
MKQNKLIVLAVALLLLLAAAIPAWAGEEEVETASVQLSLEDAVSKALNNSKYLSSLEKEVDLQDELMDQAMTNVYYTPVDRNYGQAQKSAFMSYYNQDMSLKRAKKNLENEKLQLVVDTRKAYFDVLTGNKSIAAKEKAISVDELKLKQAKAKLAVGMATDSDIKTAEAQLASDKASLEEAKAALDTAYTQLITYTGLEEGTRPVLTSDIEVEFKPIDDVERTARVAADGSYELWSAEEAARLADTMKIFQTYIDVGEYNKDIANLTAESTEENIRLQLRDMCNSINTLLEKRNQLLVQKDQLEESCRVLQLQYDLGMTTKDALESAQASLVGVDASISELSAQYATSMDTLDKYMGKIKIEKD